MPALRVCDLSQWASSSSSHCSFGGLHTVAQDDIARASKNLAAGSRACQLQLTGRPFVAAHRADVSGQLPSAVHFAYGLGNFSMFDADGRRVMVTTHHNASGMGDHGANNVIVRAWMERDGEGRGFPVALRIMKNLHPRCTNFWSPADLFISLSRAAAWPTLEAAGCCPYPRAANQSEAAVSGGGARDAAGATSEQYLYLTVRPLRRPFSVHRGIASELTLCAARGWTDHECALHLVRASLRSMHFLLEQPMRASLREHFLISDPRGQPVHRLAMGQWCQDTHDGGLCICDTEHVELEAMTRPATTEPPSPSRGEGGRAADTPTMRWAPWTEGSLTAIKKGLMPHNTSLVDALHSVLTTLLEHPPRELGELVPELLPLAQEVKARHLAIEAGCQGAEQLTFACAHDRLLTPTRL